jgi:hypothetical protein
MDALQQRAFPPLRDVFTAVDCPIRNVPDVHFLKPKTRVERFFVHTHYFANSVRDLTKSHYARVSDNVHVVTQTLPRLHIQKHYKREAVDTCYRRSRETYLGG